MKNTPKEETLNFIQRKYFRERVKWEAGFKSDYYEWEELYNEITPFLSGENYEIKRKEIEK